MPVRRRTAAVLGLALAGSGLQALSISAAQAAPLVDVQILATNDFHGRIAADPNSASAGAAVLAGAVEQLRGQHANTVFAAAGDLIGASTFDSFIDNDKPTIDSLNEAGLEVSAVGNHEFDQGYDDLVDRVMADYDASTNPQGGAEWQYLGANVKLTDGTDALDGTWIKNMSGVSVGFIGAVTEDLPQLVSPSGIEDLQVTDIVAATNTAADELKDAGADVVVLLVHEGSGTTDCATMAADTTSNFGTIVDQVDQNVDAIVSGHTHLEYNCSFPVPEWAGDSSRIVKERPVVSAGQYGANLNQLVFTVDAATGQVRAKTQNLLKLKAANGGPNNYPVDGPTQDIVDDAVARANVLGAAELGQIANPFARAKFANGTTENRGGESTLNNLTAEIQRFATQGPESGAAQLAFMNPGGLRADLVGTPTGSTRPVTFRQAADVQPFANTLVNLDLTGAQIKATLEQQWQPATAQRPFLKLGTSRGFAYTYDASRPQGQRILEMRLDGAVVNPAAVYSVTVNSFLAAGGDNFTALAGGAGRRDTGKSDLQAVVDYLDEYANTGEGDAPLPVDYRQQAVGVRFPAGAPASYAAGDPVAFDLTSLSMTDPSDVKDTAVTVSLGTTTLGSFPVTTTPLAPADANSNDETGTASVRVVLPADAGNAPATLTVRGAQTGTVALVPLGVGAVATTVKSTIKPRRVVVDRTRPRVRVKVRDSDGARVTGRVRVKVKGERAETKKLKRGRATLEFGRFERIGKKKVKVTYLGTDAYARSRDRVNIYVKRP